MDHDVTGLHHVTAIASSAERNVAFYAGALGLRLVKRTVNFDDPTAWHLYYGDAAGTPGSVLTFFVWPSARPGRHGVGQVAETRLAVPAGALDFWAERLPGHGARVLGRGEAAGGRLLRFTDPDGLMLALVESDDGRAPWSTQDVPASVAIRGMHGVALSLADPRPVASILTGVLGYEVQDGGTGPVSLRRPGSPSGHVELRTEPGAAAGSDGAGAVHHVAFAVPDRAAQARVRARMQQAGLRVTESIDRDYFWAIYSRTPGGVLFEVATGEPGFAVDEAPEALGSGLRLPARYEPHRAEIERRLPPLGTAALR